ncbi:GTPase and tRNA-U34 5-formylation enzyme TrmE [Coxiella-like endosymbiont]|uniref:tRNA uridine-5-carboxymethylaminomethyl(34) synthesis GTPase MnmE n=1 Tax=Coxiella endosymbiont of Rhipicephalus microplus TaxID=1656186 RepID=UPI000C7F8C5A|nr:tRNA uridine-5-carboxymethylaminomethyl(34) synthesis GTPase MnmE [Coxiella endosymbiont of Rhipicephalus microplus]PMB54758.1 GTPase and tRNA-U34 5-formylation enzyme TrmE [Coxiella-like endosymbiont]
MKLLPETIAALATPAGRGGIGIIRVSGPSTLHIAKKIIGFIPKPRYATLSVFKDSEGSFLDEGVALYFPKPHSFTGEDVLELQGHGGPVIMDRLLKNVIQIGARLARPGEFCETAFLNNKIDLVQAEAVADLINASSEEAARSAIRSLQGKFSKRINELVRSLVELRTYIEAAIDFPTEEIDFLVEKIIEEKLEKLLKKVEEIEITAKQGALLQHGISVVIAGEPNVGKSSLLNLLSGQETAIVTDIAGTTRDILRELIYIDGIPIQLLDTAGLRITEDIVEKEGIQRTKKALEQADLILLIVDTARVENAFQTSFTMIEQYLTNISSKKETRVPIIVIENKIDLTGEQPSQQKSDYLRIKLSVKTGDGIEILKEHLKEMVGLKTTNESTFMGRGRHCDAIKRSKTFLQRAYEQLVHQRAGELVAEDLLYAQNALSEITGEFTSDDLLGKIFSEFCIGK